MRPDRIPGRTGLAALALVGAALAGTNVANAHEGGAGYPSSSCSASRALGDNVIYTSDHLRNVGERDVTVRCPVLGFDSTASYQLRITVRAGYHRDEKQTPGDRIRCYASVSSDAFATLSVGGRDRNDVTRPATDIERENYAVVTYTGDAEALLTLVVDQPEAGGLPSLSCRLPPGGQIAGYAVREL